MPYPPLLLFPDILPHTCLVTFVLFLLFVHLSLKGHFGTCFGLLFILPVSLTVLQLYMKVSDCLDRYSDQTVHRIRTLLGKESFFVCGLLYGRIRCLPVGYYLSGYGWRLVACIPAHFYPGCRIFPAVFCTLKE